MTAGEFSRLDETKARLASWRRRRRLTRRELDELEPRIVWIFGSPRSGSTWLLDMLAEAPEPGAARLDEPRVGELLNRPFFFRKKDGDELAVTSMSDANRDSGYWILSESRSEIWRPWLRGLILESFRDQVRHGAAQTRWKRPLLIVKEPNSSEAADEVARILPRSRIVFLLRDGRDVTDSVLDGFVTAAWGMHADTGWAGLRPEEREGFIRGSALHWVYRTEAVQRACAELGPGASITVRYEDLLADTPAELARIGHWLGFEDSEAWATEIAPKHAFEAIPADQRGRGKFHRAASPGLWRENMSEAEQRIMGEVMGAKLRELGYE